MHFQNARLRGGGRHQRCVCLLWARSSGSVLEGGREGVSDIPQLQGTVLHCTLQRDSCPTRPETAHITATCTTGTRGLLCSPAGPHRWTRVIQPQPVRAYWGFYLVPSGYTHFIPVILIYIIILLRHYGDGGLYSQPDNQSKEARSLGSFTLVSGIRGSSLDSVLARPYRPSHLPL